jgi:protein-S-isoprenylcysteine O-methyltransferase Ste14
MDKKMSLMGVAGKIVVVLLISVAVTAGIGFLLRPLFKITDNYGRLAVIAVVTAIVGFTFNLIAAFGMLKAYGKGQLATKGLYSVFLNPMYTFQIFITLPGLLLFLNSWLVLVSIIPVFIAFKVFAKEEEKYLEGKFGDQYRNYKKTVIFKFL